MGEDARGAADNLAVDEAENPLQLLARTSELFSNQNRNTPDLSLTQRQRLLRYEATGTDLERFFSPSKPILDVGPDLDPISLGLVELSEAEALFLS